MPERDPTFLSPKDRMASRKIMGNMPRADIVGNFSSIVDGLSGVAKRMRRSQVLPPDMDLSESMLTWDREVLGKGIIGKHHETGKEALVGYILPVADDFLLFFNNGIVCRGQVTETTQSGYFTPRVSPWKVFEGNVKIFTDDGELTDRVTKELILKTFTERAGLQFTLFNDNDNDVVKLRDLVTIALQEVEERRTERDDEISDLGKIFTDRMEGILIEEGNKEHGQNPEEIV